MRSSLPHGRWVKQTNKEPNKCELFYVAQTPVLKSVSAQLKIMTSLSFFLWTVSLCLQKHSPPPAHRGFAVWLPVHSRDDRCELLWRHPRLDRTHPQNQHQQCPVSRHSDVHNRWDNTDYVIVLHGKRKKRHWTDDLGSGALAEWLADHPVMLSSVLPLVLQALGNPDLSVSSVSTLKKICRECKYDLPPYATNIVAVSQVQFFHFYIVASHIWKPFILELPLNYV